MGKKVVVGVDIDGGDFGEISTVPACIKALKMYPDIHIKLFGDASKIEKYQKKLSAAGPHEIINASEKINSKDTTTAAMRKKKSSMHLAFEDLYNKKIDALVTCGSTTLLSILASKIKIKDIRPVISTSLPKAGGSVVYIADCGANINSTAQNLVDNATMGNLLVQSALGKKDIKVGLLNIGVELGKGPPNVQEAHEMLLKNKNIRYIGYVEPYDFYTDKVDLMVCNGLEGNIMLKSVQASMRFMIAFNKRYILTKISAPYWLYMKYMRSRHWTRGGYILGVKGNIIKMHGNSSPYAVICGIRDARLFAIEKLDEQISLAMKSEKT